MLSRIDELSKTCKLANDLQFLLDVRDCDMSTLRDLVAVESFETLMEREGGLMRTLDYFSIEDARLRF